MSHAVILGNPHLSNHSGELLAQNQASDTTKVEACLALQVCHGSLSESYY